jgi:predicted DNA-binding transcriptional regulator YafY
VRLDYRDDAGSSTRREVEPLCLAFWGGKWTLGGWCRLREAFRNFRPDRMLHWDVTGERFADHAGRNLAAYVASMQHPPAGME